MSTAFAQDLSQKHASSSQSEEAIFRRVALVGNPNSGKSTLFNALTGLRQKVGNYPGVTVEKKVGRCFSNHGKILEVLDLPGSYSLQVRSPDEEISRDVLLGRRRDTPKPDVVVCVIDASNLERNLYFVTQILELKLPVIVALNMVDVAEARGWIIDLAQLQLNLGVPVVRMVASKGVGIIELRQALSQQNLPLPQWHAPMPEAIDFQVNRLAEELVKEKLTSKESAYAEAVLALTSYEEKPQAPNPDQKNIFHLPVLSEIIASLQESGSDPIADSVEARYHWIQTICQKSLRGGSQVHTEHGASKSHSHSHFKLNWSDRIDLVLTHRVWGWVTFLAIMGLMFFCIFQLATVPVDWIQDHAKDLANMVKSYLPAGDLQGLLTDGVIVGVGTVVAFLPQILVLFFFIGLLEDTGYMARAAFIIDRIMTKVGLHGKSFIPLLNSFACAIPGIMSTRTIENPKDRLATILVAPLMSCSARLPIYTLLIAALLPSNSVPAWEKAGIMLGVYLFGMVAAFGMAWVFKKTWFKGETPMLILELPPYRLPSLKSIIFAMWHRANLFLKRAGTVILALSIVLWALATYPKHPDPKATPSEALSYTAAGRLGHAVEPIIKPLGYDWKIGIGLITSFAQREVFVSTLAVIYNVDQKEDAQSSGPAQDEVTPLKEALLKARWPDGRVVFTPLVCVGLMVFYALAMQCMSTLAVVRRETNSWRWPIFQLCYMTLLAYTAALIVYQGGRLLGFH